MKKVINKFGLELVIAAIVALLIGLEYVIAAILGLTINGMTYAEYTLAWMASHPILTIIEGLLIGWMVGISTDILFEELD